MEVAVEFITHVTPVSVGDLSDWSKVDPTFHKKIKTKKMTGGVMINCMCVMDRPFIKEQT